jgi:uncharacterized RDD family membrane protein YckC
VKDRRKEYSLEYAGFWIRLAAGLIDLSILLASLYVLYCVVSQSFFWVFPDISRLFSTLGDVFRGAKVPGSLIWLMATILLVFLVGSTVYFVACWATAGQTVGKMSVGIKVIRTDSSRVDWKYAFIRFLGAVICTATLGVGFIMIAFNSRKQGLHDRMADTYVVKLPVKQVVYDRSLAGGRIG